nr:hypothetical protein [uncultured Pseudomonas sp.]
MSSKVKSVAEGAIKKILQAPPSTIQIVGTPALSLSPLPAAASFNNEAVSFCRSGITKKARAMFKHSKVRQAGLIVFATTLLLILPNLTRLFG